MPALQPLTQTFRNFGKGTTAPLVLADSHGAIEEEITGPTEVRLEAHIGIHLVTFYVQRFRRVIAPKASFLVPIKLTVARPLLVRPS
jgi:hypothetical protein